MTDESNLQLSDDVSREASVERTRARSIAFVGAIPPALARREDALPTTIAAMNASPRSKLRAINAVIAEISDVAKPFVACKQGCSSCCRMNVTISQVEANEISQTTGRRCQTLAQQTTHETNNFVGVACPFLVDDACSIYDARPFVCRQHHSFDSTAYWCHPERLHAIKVQLVEFGGARLAYDSVVRGVRGAMLADIRDFFPDEAS